MTNEEPNRSVSLKPVSAESLAAFDGVSRDVEEAVASECLAQDDPGKTMGNDAQSMIRTGLGFVTKMLRATMSYGATGIMNDEIDWGHVRLPHYGVSGEMVFRNFRRYTRQVEKYLPEDALVEIRPWLSFMLEKQKEFAEHEPK